MAKILDPSTLKNAKVYWPAQNESSIGALPAFSLEVPPTLSGCLCIYKVPVCESNPDGYWYFLNTGQYWNEAEPGCEAWERTLLARIRFTAAPADLDDESTSGQLENVVEFMHPEVPFNDSQLNPNDYKAMMEDK